MGTPEYYPTDMRAGKTAHDYVTRYTQKFNPERRYSDARDAVHIKNVSVLFD
jgi:hypothetical protein